MSNPVYEKVNVSCPAAYVCRTLTGEACVDQKHMCDGIPQCPFHEDESGCIYNCPDKCKCDKLVYKCDPSAASYLPLKVRGLDFSFHPFDMTILSENHWSSLVYLNLSFCEIRNVTAFTKQDDFTFLRVLDLNYNQIQYVPDISLWSLEELYLEGNPIMQLDITKKLKVLVISKIQITELDLNEDDFLMAVSKLDASSNDIQTLISTNTSNCQEKRSYSALVDLNLGYNSISDMENFFSVFKYLYSLNLNSNQIKNLSFSSFNGLGSLTHLSLRGNRLQNITHETFTSLENLNELDLGQNTISLIDDGSFSSLYGLKTLLLDGNDLCYISNTLFSDLNDLTQLSLANNNIRRISIKAFANVNYLQYLNISKNYLSLPENGIFSNQGLLRILDLRYNNLMFSSTMFRGLGNLEKLYVDSFTYCCSRPSHMLPEDCISPENIFSSCSNLINVGLLSIAIWFTSVLSISGNIFALIFRSRSGNILRSSYDILVTELSLSDLVTGIYLLIIAEFDIRSRGKYGNMDADWRNSRTCTFAGVLVSMSSIASTFFILAITCDRLVVLKYPFSNDKSRRHVAFAVSVFIWIFALLSGTIPLFNEEYFRKNFYSRSSVCISIPLTASSLKLAGWEYTVALFIGLNMLIYLLICIGQVMIFVQIKISGMKQVDKKAEREITVAKTLSAVVISDTLCWIPITIFGRVNSAYLKRHLKGYKHISKSLNSGQMIVTKTVETDQVRKSTAFTFVVTSFPIYFWPRYLLISSGRI